MQLIDAINIGMRAIGHSNIADEQTKNPNAGHIKSIIEQKTRSLLAIGWWFNTIYQAINVPDSGVVTIPYNALAVYDEGNTRMRYGIRDKNLLYDLTNQTSVFTPRDVLLLKFILDVEFRDLPEYAAQYVANAAAAEVYMNDLGMDNNSARYEGYAQMAQEMLRIEDIRNRKINIQDNPRHKRITHFLSL